MTNEVNNYVRLDRIKECKATYNVLIGQRSNGKTYAVLEEILKLHHEKGLDGAIIRRTDEDFKSLRARQMWQNLVNDGLVEKYTSGVWNDIVYFSGGWYFAKYDPDIQKTVKASAPFCYKFALNTMEHDKSTSYPTVGIIMFDEFIARGFYIPEEFILFQNTISTIVRNKGVDEMSIYMCGNTVNKYCPYFEEMGLTNVKNMKAGELEVYTYGDTDLKVAVQYTDNLKINKSEVFFAFNNPKLKMITQGAWELDIYPHLPEKYKPEDVKFYFVLEFDQELMQGEVISVNHKLFAYIHRKTTPITENDFVYTTKHSNSPRYCRNLLNPQFKWGQRIASLFKFDKVFYQNNTIGDTVNNYLNWCRQH